MNTIQIIIEVFIAAIVLSLQIYYYRNTLNEIFKLALFFPENKLDESCIESTKSNNGTIEAIRIDETNCSENFQSIIVSINRYLYKNRGVTNFSIIKSIVERSIEKEENNVSSNINLPLYIGLMGTFVGIIVGLFKIGFWGIENNIEPFIGGVVIAMLASFCGLFLTVRNNSLNFKNAKEICDVRKNEFYDFLQVELLPHLENSLFEALDLLKLNINDFNKKFENNIKLFDAKFESNIITLKDSVESLSENIGAIVHNTKIQKEFLLELKKIGYNRMAEANVKVFSLFKEAGPVLVEFIDKQKDLTNAVEKASQLVGTIDNVLNRIKSFEESVNNLGASINTNQFIGNDVLKRIDINLNYLDKQFELLKQHEISSSESIEDFFKSQYLKIQEVTHTIKREAESAFDINIENNPFQKLLILESVSNHLNEIKLKLDFNGEFKKITDGLNSTRFEIQEIKQKFSQAIEDNRISNLKKVSRTSKSPTQSKINKKSFISRFTSLFKFKRG